MGQEQKIRNLRNVYTSYNEEYKRALYAHLTDMGWWSDDNIVNDIERERFLYEAFIDYYNIIINGEVKETEIIEEANKNRFKLNNSFNLQEAHKNRFRLINLCKLQLDREIDRVRKKDYIREDF